MKRGGDDEDAPAAKKAKKDDGEDEDEATGAAAAEEEPAQPDLIAASQGLSEREQLRLLMEQSKREEEERAAAAKEAESKAAEAEEERKVKARSHVEEGGASWAAMSMGSARRWWEGSSGFDFMNEKKGTAVADGMKTEGDPGGWTGKIVKRSFGRGVISYGKVLGWFPPEEDDPEENEVLWHVLHADGDEEDLDEAEVREAVAWAEEAESGDEESLRQLEAARLADATDLKAKRRLELAERSHERELSLQNMLRDVPSYTSAAPDASEAACRGLEFIFQLSKVSGWGAYCCDFRRLASSCS